MKALGIVAIVVASIAVVIPVFGASWLPLIAGIMAVIAVMGKLCSCICSVRYKRCKCGVLKSVS